MNISDVVTGIIMGILSVVFFVLMFCDYGKIPGKYTKTGKANVWIRYDLKQ